MANLADVIQQLGPNVIYNERTSRFHDMAQNYKMVSTKNVIAAGTPTRGSDRQTGYVSQETFDAFRSDVYRYISQVAINSRDALVEIQRAMAGERKDSQDLLDQERKNEEDRRERRREKIEKIASTINAPFRAATGMGALGALGTAAAAMGIAALANMTPEQINRLQESITSATNGVRDFFNTLERYGTMIAAIGAGLLALAAAAPFMRGAPTGPRTPPPRTQPPQSPRGGAPSGGGAGGRPGSGAGAAPRGSVPQVPGPRAQTPSGPIQSTDSRGQVRFRDPTTGRFVAAPTTPGTPTPAQTPAQPTGAPERARNALPRRMIRAGALSALFQVIPSGIDAYRLIRERNEGQLSEEEFKTQMINLVGGALGGMAGAAAGAAIGTLLGPVGTIVGGIAGGILGETHGPEIARALFRAYLDETESSDDYFQQMAQGAQIGANMETELSQRLASLRQESRERVVSTENLVNQTEKAVTEGRITEQQAKQLEEYGSRVGIEPLSADKIGELVQQLQAGGADARVGMQGRNVVVLPPIVQPIQRQSPGGREPPSSDPMQPGDIQTNNPDPMFEEAAAAAAFSSSRRRTSQGLNRQR